MIFRKTWEEHLKHVKQTLDVLKREKIMLNSQNVNLEKHL